MSLYLADLTSSLMRARRRLKQSLQEQGWNGVGRAIAITKLKRIHKYSFY